MNLVTLEDFYSPLLSIEEKWNKQKLEWKQQIMISFQDIFIEMQNCIIDGQMTDLFVSKRKNRQIAFFFSLEENRVSNENISMHNNNILCFYFSLKSDDIFQIINKVMKILNKRMKSYSMIHLPENDTKYREYLNAFWEESILLSNESVLTKRKLSVYFHKWTNTKCVKISSRILFQYMDEKMGQYNNGWKHYKLNYGITEEDFE